MKLLLKLAEKVASCSVLHVPGDRQSPKTADRDFGLDNLDLKCSHPDVGTWAAAQHSGETF